MNAIRRIGCSFIFAIGMCVFAGSAMAFDLGGMLKQVEKAAQQLEPEQNKTAQPPANKETQGQQEPQGQPVQQQQPVQGQSTQQSDQQPSRSRYDRNPAPGSAADANAQVEAQKEKARLKREQERDARRKEIAEEQNKRASDEASKGEEERKVWIQNPTSPAPKSVTEDDKQKVLIPAVNKIFSVLNSAELKDAYTVCKNKESVRMNKNIQEVLQSSRDQAKNAATVAERDKFLAQAKELENGSQLIPTFAPASCLQIITTRALSTLNKNNPGIINESGLYRVSKALANKEFTSKFYSDLASELKYNHDEWFKEFVWKESMPLVEATGKSLCNDNACRKDYIARTFQQTKAESDNELMTFMGLLRKKLVTP